MKLLQSVPRDTIAMASGLVTLGVTAYLFLLLAGRVLGDEAYAPLGALWILVFLIGPAFLYPIEQELSRALSARRSMNIGTLPVVKRASVLALGITVSLVGVVTLASPALERQLFDGDFLLLASLAVAIVSYAAAYVARGVYAGHQRLSSYGVLIGAEGVVRLCAAIALALAGVDSPGAYGLAIGFAPLVAVPIAIFTGTRQKPGRGPSARWGELTASMGNLVAAAIFAQLLVNSAPLVVKYLADAGEQARAGAFAKAVVITRIPLFLFQAVQAVMLPRLTHLATTGEHAGFATALRNIMFAVGAVGVAGTLGVLVFGGELLTLFGSDTGIPRLDITLLAVGNAVFLLAITASQALIAVKGQADTVVAWLLGVVTFAGVTAVPGDLLLRVELALIVGSTVSLAAMLVLLRRRLRLVDASEVDLAEALDPLNELGQQPQ